MWGEREGYNMQQMFQDGIKSRNIVAGMCHNHQGAPVYKVMV